MQETSERVAFLNAYPEYDETGILDRLRRADFSRLDNNKQIYLDYTGGGLYAESQIQQHFQMLSGGVFGNPHSTNPSSMASTELVEQARQSILQFFCAEPEDYVAIFTGNASGALKIIGESYPFNADSRFLLTFDNHNSVNGIREFARARNASVTYVPVTLPDMRVDADRLAVELSQPGRSGRNLFAFPAQSNFSGVQHSLEWIEKAHSFGWDVLLDAAAFVPSNRLDLSIVQPDFVSVSFYKMFGYPTGIGALIARKKALNRLHRPWFAGGTITVASVMGDKHFLADGHSAFEDGTLDYLSIPAIEIGLKYINSIGYETIHKRVSSLTGWLLSNLHSLTHSSGEPLIRIYGPVGHEARGGSIALNFFDRKGRPIDHRMVERKANDRGISLRTGCFCNPGAGELALGISSSELETCFAQRGHGSKLSLDDFRLCIDGKNSGAVRISIGLVSNFEDVQGTLLFARGLLE